MSTEIGVPGSAAETARRLVGRDVRREEAAREARRREEVERGA